MATKGLVLILLFAENICDGLTNLIRNNYVNIKVTLGTSSYT